MRPNRRRLVLLLSLAVVLLAAIAAPRAAVSPEIEARVQVVIDNLRDQLAIDARVSATLVQANSLLVSVEPSNDGTRAFRMSFDAAFLEGLTEADIRAVVAHELGHVWIFTHHPYLQTERLANRVAMRVVSRDSLERVYAKVWERGGAKGDLEHFLGH